ncbi:hypothetical protein MAHJHV57_52180 [Mycobacterium avium subsp. hominissuis]
MVAMAAPAAFSSGWRQPVDEELLSYVRGVLYFRTGWRGSTPSISLAASA